MSDKAFGRESRTSRAARRGRGDRIAGGAPAPSSGSARRGRTRPTVRLGVLVLAGGLLAGCSEAWDTISRPLDPLAPAEPETIEAPQEGAGEYPSLGSVPEAPPRRPSGREERRQIRDSLSADRANAQYTDQAQTGEGIDAQAAGTDDEGAGAAEATESGTAGAPERPQAAERMPDDDAGARTDAENRAQTAAEQRAEPSRGDAASADGTAAGTTAAASTADQSAPNVPQLEPSERGEPIEVPAQPDFDGPDGTERSGTERSGTADPGADPGTSADRAPRRQSARRAADGAGAPGPAVGQSRTFSRQDTGGQMQAGGGRRVAVIYFRHGSAKLQARDRTVLRDVVELYERRDRDLRVVGHASSRTAAMDPIAHRMANFDTSLARAQAVVDALVSLGVPRDDIQLEARGDNEPVYHEFMPTGEAGNRRTEIFLQG
jgi:flagellar motor protein MotB